MFRFENIHCYSFKTFETPKKCLFNNFSDPESTSLLSKIIEKNQRNFQVDKNRFCQALLNVYTKLNTTLLERVFELGFRKGNVA